MPPITPGASVTLDPSASGGSTEGVLLALPKRTKRLVFFISIVCLADRVYVAGLSFPVDGNSHVEIK